MRLEPFLSVPTPEDINVIIEVPVGGEPIKYEMDKTSVRCLLTDTFTLQCDILVTTVLCPILSDDGDPVDVIIASTRAITPERL